MWYAIKFGGGTYIFLGRRCRLQDRIADLLPAEVNRYVALEVLPGERREAEVFVRRGLDGGERDGGDRLAHSDAWRSLPAGHLAASSKGRALVAAAQGARMLKRYVFRSIFVRSTHRSVGLNYVRENVCNLFKTNFIYIAYTTLKT